MTQDLKPCPFCGRHVERVSRACNHSATGRTYIVSCFCGGFSACAHQQEDTLEEVVAAWNTRALTAPAQVPSPWQEAVAEELALLHMACPDDPREAMKSLIAAHCAIALNPAVSEAAAALVAGAPAQVPMTDEQAAVLRFLLGESGIDECHFGDMHPDKRGRFWWRENLRKAFGITQQEAGSQWSQTASDLNHYAKTGKWPDGATQGEGV